MSRSTVVYLVMLVASAGGLWLILRAGYGLRAPTDLGGVWVIGGEDSSVSLSLGETVTIEQSGRFVRLSFDRGLHVDVKLTEQRPPAAVPDRMLDMVFEGANWKLTALGNSAGGPLIFELAGPAKHTFTATRKASGAARLAEASPRSPPPTRTADAGSDAP